MDEREPVLRRLCADEFVFLNSELASSGLPTGRELEILEGFRGRVPAEVFTQDYRLPTTDGSGNNRDGIRRALALLQQAGWQVRDRRLVNAQGQRFEFEILLNTPSFERVALPYVQWLERLGMSVRVRTVDPAQYQTRIDAFDYDMTVDSMSQSLSPGNEQRDYFTCAKARENGSQNVPGICDPAIDELVELVVNAPDRAELVARTRALDRVLLWNHFVIPHWHIQSFRIAFWDKFGRPGATRATRSAWIAGGSTRRANARWPMRAAASSAHVAAYILRRLLLVIPTLLGIILINFAVVQFAPAARWNRCWRNCAERVRPSAASPAKAVGKRASPAMRALAAVAAALTARSAAIAARAGSTLPSSPTSNACSASTSPPMSASRR